MIRSINRIAFGATLAFMALAPLTQAQSKPEQAAKDSVSGKASLELVFVIDTTGSMGGLIEGAKSKVWSIVNEVLKSQSHPKVKVGLVAYRDLGDSYVTKVEPLSSDLDKIYSTLMSYTAEGGGDTPENVRQALLDGVRKSGWSQKSSTTAQIIFLVGDAPPHNDYKNIPDCVTTAGEAVKKGIIVNTIECGSDPEAKTAWQEISRRGEGQFFAIEQNGGVVAISTPYDAELSTLSGKIGSTYSAYGAKTFRGAKASTQAANEGRFRDAAPASAQAERALNKAINSEAYDKDLVQDVANGKVKLRDLKTDQLPDDLQKLSPEDREKEVAKRIKDRKAITNKILELSKKRDAFQMAELKKRKGSNTGFDEVVRQSLKAQVAKKGIKM